MKALSVCPGIFCKLPLKATDEEEVQEAAGSRAAAKEISVYAAVEKNKRTSLRGDNRLLVFGLSKARTDFVLLEFLLCRGLQMGGGGALRMKYGANLMTNTDERAYYYYSETEACSQGPGT